MITTVKSPPPKDRPIIFTGESVRKILDGVKTQTRRVDASKRCQFEVGQKLWVKETWTTAATNNVCHRQDDYLIYRATDPEWSGNTEGWKWRSPLFMPRNFSRLTLEVTAVRSEPLHKISNSDVLAEGIDEMQIEKFRKFFHPVGGYWQGDFADRAEGDDVHRLAFGESWNRINGKKHPWSSNPMVWVVTFKVIGGAA